MEISEIREKMSELNSMLPPEMKKYIHFRSMKNFESYFEEIKSSIARAKIMELFSEYFRVIKANDYFFKSAESIQLAKLYVFKIGEYYKDDADFKYMMRLRPIILFGLIGDGMLFLFHISSKIFYIPVVTIIISGYYLFVWFSRARKGRVFGVFY